MSDTGAIRWLDQMDRILMKMKGRAFSDKQRNAILGVLLTIDPDSPFCTTPQPVTPAGGEVEPVAWVNPQHLANLRAAPQMSRTIMTTPLSADQAADRTAALYLHPPVADAALVLDAERYRFMREQNASLEPDAWTITRCDFPEGEGPDRYWVGCDLDAAVDEAMSKDAALNQRGGGV